jgi:2'-5' RNA ligase
MLSLFTAIEIPDLIRSQLSQLQSFPTSGWDANWVPAANFHITLAYAGDVEEPLANDLDTELRNLRSPGFELELKGVGAFGGARPGVLYAAVTRPRGLVELQERHARIMRRLGIEVDSRKYTPHVTLARPRRAPLDAVQAWIVANNLYASGPIPVERAILYSSHKAGGGRHYEPEREYPLGPILI